MITLPKRERDSFLGTFKIQILALGHRENLKDDLPRQSKDPEHSLRLVTGFHPAPNHLNHSDSG